MKHQLTTLFFLSVILLTFGCGARRSSATAPEPTTLIASLPSFQSEVVTEPELNSLPFNDFLGSTVESDTEIQDNLNDLTSGTNDSTYTDALNYLTEVLWNLVKKVEIIWSRLNNLENELQHQSQGTIFAHANKRAPQFMGHATTTPVRFDGVVEDASGNFNPNTGAFIAPVSGIYSINGWLAMNRGASRWTTDEFCAISVTLNGGRVSSQASPMGAAPNVGLCIVSTHAVVRVTAGTPIGISAIVNRAAGVNIEQGALQIVFISK